jgi:putative ABC transport system ATP-binding protein
VEAVTGARAADATAGAPAAVERLGRAFDGVQILRDCTHAFTPGEVTLLLGPSGSGKTTLLTLVAGFQRPTHGTVRLFGRDVREYGPAALQRLRARRMTFVFQGFLLVDGLSVLRNVLLPARFGGYDGPQARERASRALAELGLAGREGHAAGALSHGEKQRVVVARALACRSELVIADEPTASIDAAQGRFVMARLADLAAAAGSCVIVASHDERLAGFAHRVLRLQGGRLVGGSPS